MRLGWDKALLMQIIQLSDEFNPSPMNFGTQKNLVFVLMYICKNKNGLSLNMYFEPLLSSRYLYLR